MRPIPAVILLTLLCLPLQFWNLTDLGLYNTQEAIRVNVAREMQHAGEWLLPIRNAEPYIAKPPMVYWCQIALARLRGATVSEFDLRLNAALWGWLGVLATYFTARTLLRPPPGDPSPAPGGTAQPIDAPFWSATILAVGVLFSLSARVGEIDVMLAAPVTAAIGFSHASWRSALERGRLRWTCVLGATLCAAVAAFVKGPAGLIVIACGAVAPILLYAALHRGAPRLGKSVVSRPLWLFRQLESTHFILMLGAPPALLWLWLRHCKSRIGEEAFARLIAFETADNLRWLDPGAWRYAEVLAYALGVFTPLAFFGLWAVARHRRGGRAVHPGLIAAACWFIAGVAVFALTTKGVGRYLTPVWPAMAILAAVGLRAWAARESYPARIALIAVTALLAQAGALAWWHAFGRTTAWADRSPRDFMREVLTHADPAHLGSLNFNFDAFDYYAGRSIEVWSDGRFGAPVSDLAARLHSAPAQPCWLLVLEENDANRRSFGSAVSDLAAVGLAFENIPIEAPYRRPPGDARVLLWKVRPHAPTSTPASAPAPVR